MATFNLINDWLENMQEVSSVDSDAFLVALSSNAPAAEGTPPTGDGAGVLANVTQIVYTFCSSRALTLASSAQVGGTFKLDFNDLTLTASGGVVGPFRYVYIYNDTPTAPADPLVCYFDYGSEITLADGESIDLNFHANGLYQLT